MAVYFVRIRNGRYVAQVESPFKMPARQISSSCNGPHLQWIELDCEIAVPCDNVFFFFFVSRYCDWFLPGGEEGRWRRQLGQFLRLISSAVRSSHWVGVRHFDFVSEPRRELKEKKETKARNIQLGGQLGTRRAEAQ